MQAKQLLDNVRLLAILDNLEDAVLIADSQFKIVYLNDAAAQLYGVKAKQVLGTDATSVYIPGLITASERKPRSVSEEEGKKYQSQTRLLVKKNGEEAWVETKHSVLLDETGQRTGVLIITRDITEKKEMQDEARYLQALRNEAQREVQKAWNEAQRFFEFANDPFFLLDANLKFTAINIAAERLFSKSFEEIVGQKIDRVLPQIVKTELYRQLVNKKEGSFREFISPFGIWIQGSIFSWKDNNDMHTGVHIIDITENVMLERKLCESEVNYQQLVNSIQQPFFALDNSLRIIFWNDFAKIITNILPEKAIGKHITEVLPRASVRNQIATYITVLREKKPRTFTVKLEIDEDEHIFETYVYPSTRGLSILLKDVTQSRKLQAELKKYNEHLQQLVEERTKALRDAERLATIGATAGMVGHDIRNPLQTIIASIYLLGQEIKDMPNDDAKTSMTESIETINEQISYIDKIVADLQEFSKPISPISREVDLNILIKSILTRIKIPDNVKVNMEIDDASQKISSDPTCLTRILTNLISNAIQAMPNGGNLTVTTQKADDKITITVQDTGEGIPEDIKPKLFQPLVTSKSRGQGFGLAVCRRLTEAMKGEISFESERGKGTKFLIKFPIEN